MSKDGKRNFYMTSGIAKDMGEDSLFAYQVTSAMERFVDNDWGTMCGEDFEMNVNAMLTGGRIMGVYKTKLGKIWIINDDALATEQTITVLYPSEY